MPEQSNEELLRSVALRTSQSILLVRQRAEGELLLAKQALEARSEELAHSLAIMRATLDSTFDGILVVDEQGRVIDFNEQFLRMWKLPRDLVEAGTREPILQRVAKQLKDPEKFLQRTAEIYETAAPESLDTLEFADGRVVERYSKLQHMEDRVAGRVWSYHEITARVRAEAEREKLLLSEQEARARAERETRMKDEFLATVSHELRTPLNAILGWANILRSSTKAEDIAEGVEVIERNARAQAQIIEDLLDMSRIISGKVRLDVQRLELGAMIEAALESIAPMAAAKEIRATSSVDVKSGPILGDPARLQQVLWNLLTNSVKFTPRGGSVQVSMKRLNSGVEVRVTDSGQGMTADFLPHVFDRFRQADASTTRRHGGLGLGLAIVKNLVELHGGSVRAESPGEGQGSTFTITLPMVALKSEPDGFISELTAAPESEARPARFDLRGLRIVAVDDEADAQLLIERLLAERGAIVQTAGSVPEALEIIREMKPDLLISDIGMPKEDGYALMRQVRALTRDEGRDIPAIALTAFARPEDRERAFDSGFQVHLPKPVEPAELIRAVAQLAGRDGSESDSE